MRAPLFLSLTLVAMAACSAEGSAPPGSSSAADRKGAQTAAELETTLGAALLDRLPPPRASSSTRLSSLSPAIWSSVRPVEKMLARWGASVSATCVDEYTWFEGDAPSPPPATDEDADGIPRLLGATFTCGARVKGGVLVFDYDDSSSTSGYWLGFDHLAVTTDAARELDGWWNVGALSGGVVRIERDLTVEAGTTAIVRFMGTLTYVADAADDAFRSGMLTGDTETRVTRNGSRQTWKQATSLHWSRGCVGFDGGSITLTDPSGNVVRVGTTSCTEPSMFE